MLLGPKLAPIALYIARNRAPVQAVTFAAHVKELGGGEMKWDKTIKTDRIA